MLTSGNRNAYKPPTGYACQLVYPSVCAGVGTGAMVDTHPRGGAPREGPLGGFRVPIIAGRRHRIEEEKGRVKGPLQGGATGNGAHSAESVSQFRKPGFEMPESGYNATVFF